MKLTRAVRALERGSGVTPSRKKKRSPALAPSGSVVGLVWSADEAPLSRPLAAGEFLAVDLHSLGPRVHGASSQRTVERATRDPRDLGYVYNASGVRIGRVVRVNGTLITTEYDSAAGRA